MEHVLSSFVLSFNVNVVLCFVIRASFRKFETRNGRGVYRQKAYPSVKSFCNFLATWTKPCDS